MKKLLAIILLLTVAVFSARSQETFSTDKQQKYSDEYLDTVSVARQKVINDYTMVGIQGGMGLSFVLWTPSIDQQMRIAPYNVGITYTRYGKMFGYMPYFGFQAGLNFAQEGYRFKADKDTGVSPTLEGAKEAYMNVVELPIMAHCHIDFWKMKLLLNLGCFAGYRLSINRIGDDVSEDIRRSFLPSDKRFDYGVKGGAGIGFVFDPIEIHLQATYKQSLSSLYQPDRFSKYYFRYAYPANVVFTVGVHYQLTRREGKTSKMIRQEAIDSFKTKKEEDEHKNSESR